MISYDTMFSPRPAGTVATYTCDTGYDISGPRTRTCQSDTTWSGGDIVCQGIFISVYSNTLVRTFYSSTIGSLVISCGSLSISNGAVDTSSGTTFGNTATYSCDGGHILVGPNTRTCEANGNWSLGAPTCLGELVDKRLLWL